MTAQNLDFLFGLLRGAEILDFLDFLFINRSTYTRWKNHSMIPSRYHVALICEYLEISSEVMQNISLQESPAQSATIRRLAAAN